MIGQSSRKRPQKDSYPRTISIGRTKVRIYRRRLPSGEYGYQVANYASGKRRLDSYADERAALEEARRLVRQLSEHQTIAANLSDEEATAFATARQTLAPLQVELVPATCTLAECLRLLHPSGLPGVGGLASLLDAVRFYAARRRVLTRKPIAEVAAELLQVKVARQHAPEYLSDLRSRLGRFTADFAKDVCDVTTAELQHWIDGLGLSSQSCQNYRRVVHLFFSFAVVRGYAADNPALGVEKIKVRNGEIEIFTPTELQALLVAAPVDLRPMLAIGALAGVRSAELKRLRWEDVRCSGHIVIGKTQAKTASRRLVPICEALAAWLAPYTGRMGLLWPQGEDLSKAQARTAAVAGLKWKKNALRHSYASYRFAQTGDAGRVSGECGNSAAMIHKHYRQLVTPEEASRWFAIKPTGAFTNILPMQSVH